MNKGDDKDEKEMGNNSNNDSRYACQLSVVGKPG